MALSETAGDIEIREAVPEDSSGILKVVQQAFEEYKGGGQSPALRETLNDIIEDIDENKVFVVEIECRVVGTLRLELKEDKEKYKGYYLKRFAIHPQFQGQGLGTMLFNKAEQIACREAVSCIYLHSTTADNRLVKFYKRLGFECKEIDHSRGYPRGLWVKELCQDN